MRTAPLNIRPLHGEDGSTVDTVFAGLSERSRYLRFHAPMPRLPGSVRRGLLYLYPGDRAALVAEVPGQTAPVPVGIARLGRTGPADAEFAIAVVDHWHGLGIGRRLLTELDQLAGQLGFTRIHGFVLQENRPMLHLVDRVFPGADRSVGGRVIRVGWPVGTGRGPTGHQAPLLV
jgi:GNAT superfamily N-acetyltransferase